MALLLFFKDGVYLIEDGRFVEFQLDLLDDHKYFSSYGFIFEHSDQ